MEFNCFLCFMAGMLACVIVFLVGLYLFFKFALPHYAHLISKCFTDTAKETLKRADEHDNDGNH